MTTTGLYQSAPGSLPPPAGTKRDRAAAGWRLTRMYLVSRRVPMGLVLLAGLGALLWSSLHWHWNIAGGPAAELFIPLTLQAGAAAVIAVTTFGPFGEAERAAARWLPRLRLGTAVALTAAAFGALAAGAAAGGLPGGTLTLLRNLGGMAGIGLLAAAAAGGAFSWAGPMAYLLITEGSLAHRSATPWIWPARPPHDRGGAICACLMIAAGLVLITVRGPREWGHESGPASMRHFLGPGTQVLHPTTAKIRQRAGEWWQDTDLVFASHAGTELDAANVRRAFRKVTAAAGLNPADWTPRELRHSFVSLLSDAGVPVEKIARLVGHIGTSTTETVYRHQIRPVVTGGAEVMDQLFPRRDGDA